MGSANLGFKSIVTAFSLAVWLSGPLAAQETVPLDDLFDRLANAEAGEDRRIVAEIITEWSRSGSAAVDLMLARGEAAMEAGDPDQAIGHFTAAIDWAPDFAEAYHGRATAYYVTGRIGPALDDLREALVLEPRHFRAMQGFAVILEELGRPEEALELFVRVGAMHPADESVAGAVERLNLQLGGRTL